MNPECAYSFKDLYIAAFHSLPKEDELQSLYALTQLERNKVVEEWARKAGWEIKERIGTDGQVYSAFCPSF